MEMLPAMLNEDNVVEVYLIPLLIMLMILFQCARMVLYSFLVCSRLLILQILL